MIATVHVLIGGTAGIVVGKLTNDPVLAASMAYGAGFASHLIADCFPHHDAPFAIEYENGKLDQPKWTRKLYAFAIGDSIVALLLSLGIWGYIDGFTLASTFAWGALGGYSPDFIDVVPFWSTKLRTLRSFRTFHKIHVATHSWRRRPHHHNQQIQIRYQLFLAICVFLIVLVI
jgi:hypothetical protein